MTIDEIPFITNVPRDGRTLILQSWYDAKVNDWHLYFDIKPGEYIRIQGGKMCSGIYYAATAANNDDLELPLATFIAQHLSFPEVTRCLFSLVDEIQLLSASLEKLEILRLVEIESAQKSFLIETEVEYLFILIRRMYDLLQKMSKRVCAILRSPNGKPVVTDLPDSFASVVTFKDRLRTQAELSAKFRLPLPLSEFYSAQSILFKQIRDIRVGIEHHGKRLPTVFTTKQGLGISASGSSSWEGLPVWKQHELMPNKIGSVRALAGFLTKTFLETLTAFEVALRSTIHPDLLPKAVAEGQKVYLSNPSVNRVTNFNALLTKPWIDSVLKEQTIKIN